MSRVRGRDTKPEMRVRSVLHRAGYRFRLHRSDLPGRPDIYLPRYRLAVFVHGCFWHGHEGCKRSKLPETRSDFWAEKIATNRRRDCEVMRQLTALDVASVTFWECELKDAERILQRIAEKTEQGTSTDAETTEATET